MDTKKKKRRPKGDGSIQKLSKNKYRVQVTVGYDNSGRQIRKSFTSDSQKEVIATLHKFKGEGSLSITGDYLFSDFAHRWLDIKKNHSKKTTCRIYHDACVLHIIPVLGCYRLNKINTAHINDYIAGKLRVGLSSSTVNHHRAIIHGILDLACREGVLNKNVVEASNSVSTKRKVVKVLTLEQMKHLLSVARSLQSRPVNSYKYIYHIVLLALATGARRGEILALKWENIDFANSKVTIKENLLELTGGLYFDSPKTDSSIRTIAVNTNILTVIKNELWTADGIDLVFHTRSGKPIAPSSLGRSFRRLLKEAGIEGFRFHDLRHTHATRLVAAGVNVKLVSKRIGHNDIRTTLGLYTHILPEQDIEAAEKSGKWLLD